MNDGLIDAKMQSLKAELEQAEAELTKLRARVQYLEAICHRCDGALVVLQGLRDDAAQPPITGTPTSNHAAMVPQGA